MDIGEIGKYWKCSQEIRNKVLIAKQICISRNTADTIIIMIQTYLTQRALNINQSSPEIEPIAIPRKNEQLAQQIIATFIVHLCPHLPEEEKLFLYQNKWLNRAICAEF